MGAWQAGHATATRRQPQSSPMSFFYLATPYSKYPEGPEAAHIAACRIAAALMRFRIPVFSPIAHTHLLSVHGDLKDMEIAFWLDADRPMMDAAHGLIVAQLKGWRESVGVTHEIEVFKKAGKPMFYLGADSLLNGPPCLILREQPWASP
jgi:hypothetical protein